MPARKPARTGNDGDGLSRRSQSHSVQILADRPRVGVHRDGGRGVGGPTRPLARPRLRRIVDDLLRVAPRDQVDVGRPVRACEPGGVQLQPRRIEDERRHASRVVGRPDGRQQPARGVAVENDVAAVGVLGADDPQRLGDLLVMDAQVAHVVRGGVVDAGPPAGAQVQGVELVAGGEESVGQVGLEEAVIAAVEVEHGPLVARGPARRWYRPALVDQNGVVGAGCGGLVGGDGDPPGHPRLPQDVGGEGGGRGRRRGRRTIGGCLSRRLRHGGIFACVGGGRREADGVDGQNAGTTEPSVQVCSM